MPWTGDCTDQADFPVINNEAILLNTTNNPSWNPAGINSTLGTGRHFHPTSEPFPNTSIYAKLPLGQLTKLLSVSGVLTTLSGDNPEERRI